MTTPPEIPSETLPEKLSEVPPFPKRLDKALVFTHPDLSRSFLVKKIRDGSVTVNGVEQNSPSFSVTETDEIILQNQERAYNDTLAVEELDLDIVYEDDALLVVNKPSGMVVHPAPGHYTGTLLNGLLYHCQSITDVGDPARPGIVHRLDKETSGLLVVAKTPKAYQGLKAQFKERTLSRKYIAFVWGVPEPAVGIIDRPMDRHPRDRQRMRVMRTGGKEAITHYRVVQTFGSLASLINCQLKTGRTHQIRAHLANMGHGVLGDRLYGQAYQGVTADILKDKMKEVLGSRQCLHAAALTFIHPETGETLTFESPLPKDLQTCLDFLTQL